MENKSEENALLMITGKAECEMVKGVQGMVRKFRTGHTAIQIQNFILNDVEYPTPYGKFQQAREEMSARYYRIVDTYFDIRETEIKIKMEQAKLPDTKGALEYELVELGIEKLQLQLQGKKAGLDVILREMGEFYKVYEGCPEFHNLTPEKEAELEAEQWARKAVNNPLVFIERYGDEFMKKAWGEKFYGESHALLQKNGMTLPRELIKVGELSGDARKGLPLPSTLLKSAKEKATDK